VHHQQTHILSTVKHLLVLSFSGSGTNPILLLILFILCVLGRPYLNSLRLNCFKSDRDHIWNDCSSSKRTVINRDRFLARDSMLSTLYATANLSVHLSVRYTGGSSKTVEVRIMQFSPHSSLIRLVFAG